jgi:hypothetical protein
MDKKHAEAFAVMLQAMNNKAGAALTRLLDAEHPRFVMTKEGPRTVDAATRADKHNARRDLARSTRDIEQLANVLLCNGGYTTTGQKRKRK